MTFKNKVVLITGASSGIGKATAILFAKQGAKVVVNYNTSKNAAAEVVKRIEKLGTDAVAIQCDVSQESEVTRMIDKTIKRFGKIDVLINNASMVIDTPLLERTTEQRKRTMDVNLLGTFLCSKYVAKHMLKSKKGKIVNVSSTSAINFLSPDAVDYDASKAGVIVLTRDLAKELAPSIQVNSVAPGWVNTPMNKDLPQSYIDEELEKIYLKRFAEADEIAKSIVFLASSDADYITGTILKVDGGHD